MSQASDRDNGAARRVIFSVLVLGVAAAIFTWFLWTEKPPAREEAEARPALVETTEVQRESLRPVLSVRGTLQPARRLALPARVGGELVEIHPQLRVGGIVREGDLLARVDRADYRLAVERARTALVQARSDLAIEVGRQAYSREELEAFEQQSEEIRSPGRESLILREPQYRAARAAVERASAELERAELDLERTAIRVPFDAIVERETVEVGQVVQPGTVIAELAGTGAGEVEARVPVEHLGLLAIPGWNADEGSTGVLRHRPGDREIQRPVRVARLAGSLDPAGRMARLLLELSDPFELAGMDSGRRSPLLYGAFVEIDLQLDESRELWAVPASAMRNRERLFVMTSEDTLAIREPEIYLRSGEMLYLSAGLEAGDRIVTSLIANPIEGMSLRTGKSGAPDGSDAGR